MTPTDSPTLRIRAVPDPDTIAPVDVREGEQIWAELNDERAPTRLRVWRMSPFGVELVKPPDVDLQVGRRVSLRINVDKQSLPFSGSVVAVLQREKGELACIRFEVEEGERPPEGGERREHKRFLCSANYYPQGATPHPVRLGDFVYFQVKDISGKGIKCLTQTRNAHLLEGMQLDCVITLSVIGSIKPVLRISSVREEKSDSGSFIAFGAEFVLLSRADRVALGQYLLQFGTTAEGPASLKAIKEAGLYIDSASRAVEFGVVRSLEDLGDVLQLRLAAYSAAGKVAADVPASSMGDVFDDRSRIITARYRGKLVASVRLIYHGPEDQWEHEDFVTFPSNWPAKEDMVEVTRVCTHADYRGEDLLLGLFRQIIVTALQTRKRYILGCATFKLLPIYKRIGCRPTKEKFNFSAVGGAEHTIFIGDIRGAYLATHVSPVVWAAMFDGIEKLAREYFGPRLSRAERARLWVLRTLRPLLLFTFKQLTSPRKAANGPRN